mgnify:CR=1 FL=1
MLAHVVAELVGLGYVLALRGPAIPESLELFELVVIGAFTHVRRSADLAPIYDADGAVNCFVGVDFGLYLWVSTWAEYLEQGLFLPPLPL